MRAAVAVMLVWASLAAAQTPDSSAVIVGRIRDVTDSGGVGYAELRVAGGPTRRADGLGRFRIEKLDTGQFEMSVRILGYTPILVRRTLSAGETTIGDVYLTRIPAMLSQVTVRGRSLRVPSGFERIYSRAKGNPGQFMTRELIDSLNPVSVADLLATQTFARIRWTGSRWAAMVRNCIATVWLNGLPVAQNEVAITDINQYLSVAHPTTLQVVEVYDTPLKIPFEFKTDPQTGKGSCAVVLIWTRAR